MSDLAIASQINSAIGNTPAKSRLIQAQASGVADIGAEVAAQVGNAVQPLKSLSQPISGILDAALPLLNKVSPSLTFLQFLQEAIITYYQDPLNHLIKTRISDTDMCNKLLTGLEVGIALIVETLLTLPKLIQQKGLELNAQTFLERAKKTFDFIDELTQFSLDHIDDIEGYMLNGDIPHYDIGNMSGILKSLIESGDYSQEAALEVMQKILDLCKDLRGGRSLEQLHYKPELFEFTSDGRMTLTPTAIEVLGRRLNEEFADYRKLNVALTARAKPEALPYKHAYYGCPGRSVLVEMTNQETGQKEIVSLIKALHLSIIKILESMPTGVLDDYIRLAANDAN